MLLETHQPEIKFKGKQKDAWYYLNDNKTTEIFYGGAAGGGKSFLGCVWHVTNRVRYPGSRGLIGRAKIAALEQSTLITLFRVCQTMGYQIGVHYQYNSQKHVINWSNGSQTILKDLFLYPSDPDFISLGSTEYTDAFIDEGTEITQKAFDIVNSRIRWMLSDFNLIPKVLVTCNPNPGWIKDNYLYDANTNQRIVLQPYQKFVRALVTDNPDQDFVKLYSDQLSKMHSDYDRERLLYGNWDVQDGVQNPFAHQWEDAVHTGMEAVLNYHKQLYISIDFNLNPFAVTFWHYWQDQAGYHLHGIDEAEIAQGSIPAMIDLIRSRYRQQLYSCIVTGDAMGNQGNIARIDNASHYVEIAKGLGIGEHQIKVPANPTHENSRADVNKILWECKRPAPRFYVKLHPDRMKSTIRDFKIVQCDATGAIVKGKRTDLSQRADYLDTARYVMNLVFKQTLLRLRAA